jgi:hypothetical protein
MEKCLHNESVESEAGEPSEVYQTPTTVGALQGTCACEVLDSYQLERNGTASLTPKFRGKDAKMWG